MSMKDVVEALDNVDDKLAIALLGELSNTEISDKISELFHGQTFGVVFATTIMHLAVQARLSPNPELSVKMAMLLLEAAIRLPPSPKGH